MKKKAGLIFINKAADSDSLKAIESIRREFEKWFNVAGAATYPSIKPLLGDLTKILKVSDCVVIIADRQSFYPAKYTLCKALGLKQTGSDAVKAALPASYFPKSKEEYELVSSFPEGAAVFCTPNGLLSGFGVDAGNRSIIFLPLDGPRLFNMLSYDLGDYLNSGIEPISVDESGNFEQKPEIIEETPQEDEPEEITEEPEEVTEEPEEITEEPEEITEEPEEEEPEELDEGDFLSENDFAEDYGEELDEEYDDEDEEEDDEEDPGYTIKDIGDVPQKNIIPLPAFEGEPKYDEDEEDDSVSFFDDEPVREDEEEQEGDSDFRIDSADKEETADDNGGESADKTEKAAEEAAEEEKKPVSAKDVVKALLENGKRAAIVNIGAVEVLKKAFTAPEDEPESEMEYNAAVVFDAKAAAEWSEGEFNEYFAACLEETMNRYSSPVSAAVSPLYNNESGEEMFMFYGTADKSGADIVKVSGDSSSEIIADCISGVIAAIGRLAVGEKPEQTDSEEAPGPQSVERSAVLPVAAAVMLAVAVIACFVLGIYFGKGGASEQNAAFAAAEGFAMRLVSQFYAPF